MSRRGAWTRLGLMLGLWAGLCGGIVALAHAAPLPERLRAEHSTVLRFDDGRPFHLSLSADDKYRVAVPIERVDPAYLTALLRLEDKRFHEHLGVDPIAILRAARLNASMGRVVSGGSTITMQLVRMLEPRPRVLRSKVIEAFRAVQLELVLGKEAVLEHYLSYVPYGRNIEGVEAGALAYFGHSADKLSPGEIAVLLAVPQNPNRRYPAPGNAERLRIARNDIAARLAAEGAMPLGPEGAMVEPEALVAMIEEAPLPTRLRPAPGEARHAAAWILARHEPGDHTTTLDRGRQQVLERKLAALRERYRRKGIRNAAVVVIDNSTFGLSALAGNFDFFDGDGAQYASFDVPRSPGSALKPFIYAAAIDEGLVLPDFLVPDVPVRFGGYEPGNYDGEFDGLVRLEDALSRSLNLPFITLTRDIGVDRFLGRLRRTGVNSLVSEPGFYGLSIAVGGLELTPLEMAVLYTGLANDGRYEPLRVLASEQAFPGDSQQLLSEGAAYLTRRALSLRDRPDFPRRADLSALPVGVHWKTGTSSGHRDAWAVGSAGEVTAAVWLGNLDNSPSAALVGAEAAGPLLFDLLEAFNDRRRARRDERPSPDLSPIRVCAYSGHPAAEACPSVRAALALTRNTPAGDCPYHVHMEVDTATGLAVRPTCRDKRATEVRSYVFWPAPVRRWLEDRRRELPEAPSWAPDCAPRAVGSGPAIVSPAAAHSALLLPGLDASKQLIPLEAEADPGARLSWFVNGRYLGSAGAEEKLWWTPERGRHRVVVSDGLGRIAARELTVR